MSRVAGVSLGGLALALSFPKFSFWWLSLVAVVPLLVAARQVTPTRALGLGILYGVVYRGVTMYWVIQTMVRYGGLPWVAAVGGYLLLIAYLALYQGGFAWLVARPGEFGGRGALFAAAAWTGLEFLQGWLFTGLPWALLGYAPGQALPLAQAADLGGVWGLSFLAILCNALLAAALLEPPRWRVHLLAVATVLAAWAGYGAWVLGGTASLESGFIVGLVQGNVAQDLKWDAGLRDTILERHLSLSRQAVRDGARLVVWPESSWPDPYGVERDPAALERLGSLVRESGSELLVGTVRVDEVGGEFSVANAAVLFAADGSPRGRYEKSHLVPFGEYLPLQSWLRYLGPLVQAVGTLRPGRADQPLLEIRADQPIGLAICYEVIFPGLVRRQAVAGAQLLVTITNDAWFGTSSGPYQHFAMARLRAIENRRYLVRAANTGISAVVDPWGRVVAASELEREAVVVGAVGLSRRVTVFHRVGDALPLACLAILLVALPTWRRSAHRG